MCKIFDGKLNKAENFFCFFFLKVTGRGENPPPEFHSLALEWPIKWVKKFYSILILWLHCGFKGSTPGHANSKITMR